jgi:coproporphyrinogen III oxidase-like Fe-S oxidoreductase
MKAYLNVLVKEEERISSPYSEIPSQNVEKLKTHQSMTDFCHTHLRTLQRGLTRDALAIKYPKELQDLITERLKTLEARGLLTEDATGWTLSPEGRLLADRAFEFLTFLSSEIPNNFK